jgi:hypothetical protein
MSGLRSLVPSAWLHEPPAWLRGAIVGAALVGGIHMFNVLFPVRPLDLVIPPPNLERLLLTTLYAVIAGGVIGGVFGFQRARSAARGWSADGLAGVVAALAWGIVSILFGVRHPRFGYGVLFLLAAAIAGGLLGTLVWVARGRPRA